MASFLKRTVDASFYECGFGNDQVDRTDKSDVARADLARAMDSKGRSALWQSLRKFAAPALRVIQWVYSFGLAARGAHCEHGWSDY